MPTKNRTDRQGRMVKSLVLAISALIVFSSSAYATAVLIPAGEAQLREDLNRLTDRGILSISTSTWPLPLKAVSEALRSARGKRLADAESDAYLRVVRRVEQLRESSFGLFASGKTEEYKIPRSFAQEARGESEFGAQVGLSNPWAAIAVRVNQIQNTDGLNENETTLDGTYAGVQVLGQVVSIGLLDRWWGPAEQGSLILGSASRSIPALAVQRANLTAPGWKWLSWLGPWNYQILFGQLLDYESVPDTKFLGIRGTIKPFDLMEIGASRTAQFGGEGRPENLDAFWDTVLARSNSTVDDDDASDQANQLAGFDFRLASPFRSFPLALYGQFIGDDEAGWLPSKLIGSVGLEYRFGLGDYGVTWRVESADTVARGKPGAAYRNSVYPDGYYQHGLPIGYPIGGDGDLYLASLAVVTRSDFRYEARFVRATVNKPAFDINLAYPERDRIYSGSVKMSVPWRFARIGATAGYQDTVFGVDPVVTLDAEFNLKQLFGR